MIVSLVVFVVILVLSIPSAVIFIPLAVITGNVGRSTRRPASLSAPAPGGRHPHAG
jgi:hypothetical protein